MVAFIDKPEYVFRPSQILRRVVYPLRAKNATATLRLPWNASIVVRRDDVIGRSICTVGLYDLVLTETLARLIDYGEHTVDVGTNIGYATCVMAWRTGRTGTVTSFEPNATLFPILNTNLSNWEKYSKYAPISLHRVAVSDYDGEANLRVTPEFKTNCGTASLENEHGSVSIQRVPVVRLDTLFSGHAPIGMMKIDVEGHEGAVIKGAMELLSKKAIRDIVFEEHRPYPSASHRLLEEFGFRTYRLSRTLGSVLLCPPSFDEPRVAALPNYLATLDPGRAEKRMAPAGWLSLRP